MKMVIGAAAIFLVLMVLGAVLALCTVLEMVGHEGAPDYV
uniref:Uncharacterized protein n=1 Tax=mine drainage metagenome TaxID=410659 RepID=E6QB65_9ZZZZ